MPKPVVCVCLLLATCFAPLPGWGQTTLRIEVVDDSDQPFAPYVLLVGQSAAGPGGASYPLEVDSGTGQLAVANAADATNNVTPKTVDLLQSAGYSVISPYTGKSRLVRYFTATTIGSGVFMIFKNDGTGSPFVYVNNANPSPITSNFRFDLCELTFNANIQCDADITSIDAFSFPMQFDLFSGTPTATSTPIDGRYYYLSTASMLAAFQNIGAGQALYKKGPGGVPAVGWTAADGMEQFVRALAPGQFAAVSADATPAPYPSFAQYLQQLTALSGNTYQFNGSANGITYEYSGGVTSDGHGGYQMVLTGTTTPAPSPLPDGAPVTIHLPVSVQATASATVDSSTGRIQSLNINTAGSGYSNPPTVTIGGPPTEVTGMATAVVDSGGVVSSLLLNSPGSNYYMVPTIIIDNPQSGNDVATATVTISGGVITGFQITHAGSGYTPGTIGTTITPPPGVAPAKADPIISGGAVTGFTITHPGAGYISSPPVTITPSAGSMDTFLYGATLSADAFSVQGISYAALQADTNIVYGSIARDALAALNFGYVNGRYGTNSLTWYAAAPVAYPFGRARTSNDGNYNPWAALFYNYSDAYSFAFSDRSGPSPDMALQAGQTLRITILPDHRLDSPRPYVAKVNSDSLVVEWPEVPGASDYLVSVLAPSGIPPQSVPAVPGTNRYTIGGVIPLQPGTPYTFAVAALASANNQTLITPVQSVQCSTSGPRAPTPGTIAMNFSFAWPPPQNLAGPLTANFNDVILTYTGGLNGQWLQASGPQMGANAIFNGNLGLNEYVVTVQDGNSQILFTNILQATISGSSGDYTVGDASLYGNCSKITSGGTFPNQVSSITLNPIVLKSFEPALFPGRTYVEWAAGFPGLGALGGINDDPDADGLSNLMEYFQATDPTVAGLFETNAVDINPDQLVLRFRKSKSITGVFAQAEWSTDLQTWQTSGVTYDPVQDAGDHLECTARVSRAGNETMFFRLNVSVTLARTIGARIPMGVIPQSAQPMRAKMLPPKLGRRSN